MTIPNAFKGIEYRMIRQGECSEIEGLCINSSDVEEKDAFIAICGAKRDGHDYIDDAIGHGAMCIILNADKQHFEFDKYSDKITWIAVRNTRECLSKLVNNFYDHPTSQFKLVGVTGTNGKTSVTTIANHVFSRLGHKTALIGTIDNYINNIPTRVKKTTPTTPDCIELGKIMDLCVKNRVEYAFMEVSSMALKTHRVDDCQFDAAVFHNISPEHLDDHKTMEDYLSSKLQLFKLAPMAVINVDDNYSDEVIRHCMGSVLRFGIDHDEKSDLYAHNIMYFNDSITFSATWRGETIELITHTPSKFAIYNTLAVIGICLVFGFPLPRIKEALENNIPVAGRFEVIQGNQNITAVVDFAHTPVALENMMKSVRQNSSYNRIITVFGCGGDRDRAKRSVMGNISQTYSDITIITSDNPRTESPEGIIEDILVGIDRDASNWCRITNRKDAIRYAIRIARENDVILIAGRGHETEQILDGYSIAFDDRKIVRRLLNESCYIV